MKKNYLFVFLAIIVIASCKKFDTESAIVNSSSITRLISNDANGIPFADSATLNQYKSDKQIIDYRVARKMALIQLAGKNSNDMNWTGYTISEKPVLVYGFDSKPKYYEFVMYDAENRPSGTCITHAKKTAPTVVSDLITGVRDYASIATKGSGSNLQFFAGPGSSLYIGIPAKDGEEPIGITDPETGNTLSNVKEYSDEEQIEILSQANKQQNNELKSILDTTSSLSVQTILQKSVDSTNPSVVDASLQASLAEYHESRDNFWNGVTQIQDTLMNISDSSISQNTKGLFDWISDWFTSIFHGPQTSSVMINKYLNASSNITSRAPNGNLSIPHLSWCGPAAMSWLYFVRTGDDKQYNYFLNNTGRYSAGIISSITSFWNFASNENSRPMSPLDMFVSMGNITNWREIIDPWLTVSLNGGGIYRQIQYLNQPAILLSFEGGMHWSVVYGCDRTTYWYGATYYSFYLWDNGSITGDSPLIDGTGVFRHKKLSGGFVGYVRVLCD